MVLITGLGNPGEKFKKTRHNVGFQVLDEFAKRNDFPDFRFSRKFNSLLSEGFLDGKKIILAEPQTFMNESGKAIKSLVSSFKLQASRVWVIHDDIDLPLGKIRIAISRGAAGHRGIESIIKELGTKNFIRFRVGVLPKAKPKNIEKFVLQKFNKGEEKIIKGAIKKTVEAIETTLKQGLERAMNEYNSR